MRVESACLPGGAAALLDCSGLLTSTWKFAGGMYVFDDFYLVRQSPFAVNLWLAGSDRLKVSVERGSPPRWMLQTAGCSIERCGSRMSQGLVGLIM